MDQKLYPAALLECQLFLITGRNMGVGHRVGVGIGSTVYLYILSHR